ncbi:MAG TPA: DUF4294 domain-containing protein [Bacteroidia bacterium]|nr:DUF4294 domain-containing protein [Bacteroidia bacterium]
MIRIDYLLFSRIFGTGIEVYALMKRHHGFYFFIFLSFSSFSSFSQAPAKDEKSGGYRLPYIIEGEDTIPVVNLQSVNITDINNPDYLKNLQAYYRLRFNVIKVYPYARLAAVKLNQMENVMAAMDSDREKKKYRKGVEEQVRKDFEEQIKKLSINQGNVLIKLIDRETGHTSYELIKQLKGSLNAFFAQGLAKLFGHNLKDEYDPEGEDKTIEMIVKQIENGQLTF